MPMPMMGREIPIEALLRALGLMGGQQQPQGPPQELLRQLMQQPGVSETGEQFNPLQVIPQGDPAHSMILDAMRRRGPVY